VLRRWYSLPLLLVAMLVVAGVGFLYRLVPIWLSESRVAAQIEAIRAAGEPVTAEDLDRWYAYPAGDSPADEYVKLLASLVEDQAFEQQYDKWMDGDAFRPVDDAIAPAIEGYLSKNQAALVLAEQLAPRGQPRFDIDFSQGAAVKLHFLRAVRRTVRLLGFRAQLAARDGRMDDANADLVRMMQIASATVGAPFTTSHLALGVNQLAPLAAIRSVDRMGGARSQDYRLWQQMAHQVQEGSSQQLIDTLVSDRAAFIIRMRARAQKNQQLSERASTHANLEAGLAVFEEQLNLARGLPAPVESRAKRLLKDRRANQAERIAESITFHRTWSLRILAHLRVYEVAMAIRQYEHHHRSSPPNLQALTPGYLTVVPTDPFTDQPLLYRHDDSGWVVYSLGANRVDEAGQLNCYVGFQWKEADVSYATLEYERRHFPRRPKPAPPPPSSPSPAGRGKGARTQDLWGE
jgi:hypothetical protein